MLYMELLTLVQPAPKARSVINVINTKAGWWFEIFFIFTPIWGRFPF